MKAAEQRNDDIVRTRVLGTTDFLANGIKYHKSCHGHYISQLNINAAISKIRMKALESIAKSPFDVAFTKIVELINNVVLSKKRTLFSPDIRRNYIEYLKEKNVENAESYNAKKLKEKLLRHFGKSVQFVEGSGKCDILCSASLIKDKSLI